MSKSIFVIFLTIAMAVLSIFIDWMEFLISLAMDLTELLSGPEATAVETQCASQCQGDFPLPSDRMYAEGTESGPIFGDPPKATEAKNVAITVEEGARFGSYKPHLG